MPTPSESSPRPGTTAFLRDLHTIVRDPRRAEIVFALSTAAAAALGAFLLQVSPLLTAVCDVAAVVLGLAWWSARRFNRAQRDLLERGE